MRVEEQRKKEPEWEELGDRVVSFWSSVSSLCLSFLVCTLRPLAVLPVTVLSRFNEIIKCTPCLARGLVCRRLVQT